MIEHEIMAYCKRNKTSACIAFGTTIFSETDHYELPEEEWIINGIGDSFWENSYEFETGVKQADELLKKDQSISRREALFEIFGNFTIYYEVDGIINDLPYSIDIDSIMYEMLKQL